MKQLGKQIKIEICLGSSCHAKNSKELALILQDYAKNKDYIQVVSCLCTDNCSQGPVIVVNGQVYTHINKSNIIRIIKKIEKEFLENE